MTHEQLQKIVERYTPTMLDVIAGASPDEIAGVEALAGTFPESYRDFLGWMGNRCPFLEGEGLAYSPADLMTLVYEETEIDVPAGFFLVGVDKSGDGFDLYLRKADGAVTRAEYYEEVSAKDMLMENVSFASYLLTAYVRKTLAPSHPFHFSAAFKGDDDAQLQEVWRRVDEACGHFEIPYPIEFPDFRFYGGNDFVLGVHQRPASAVVTLHFGAVDRARYEPWYDLAFARWRLIRMPV
jgi:hypothetical protein